MLSKPFETRLNPKPPLKFALRSLPLSERSAEKKHKQSFSSFSLLEKKRRFLQASTPFFSKKPWKFLSETLSPSLKAKPIRYREPFLEAFSQNIKTHSKVIGPLLTSF